MSALQFEVEERESGRRLDVVLVERVEGLSRSSAKRMTAAGKVRVNGRRARKGRMLAQGDTVELSEAPEIARFAAAADPDLELPVLYEDEHVVVVDKPAGVPSHPLRVSELGTAASALVHRYPEMTHVGYSPREPGILHRLDTGTSGVMLAARDEESFDALRQQLKRGEIEKRYLAGVEGEVPSETSAIGYPIAAHPSDRRMVVACRGMSQLARLSNPQPARTEVVELTAHGDATLAEVEARTARRHQIRAHFASIGHPLLGDSLYGGREVMGLGRHFLHANFIRFVHPARDETITVRSALPKDLERVLAAS